MYCAVLAVRGELGLEMPQAINKLIHKAGKVIDHNLEMFESVRDRRSVNKLLFIVNNPCHPLYDPLQRRRRRNFSSNRLILPQSNNGSFR